MITPPLEKRRNLWFKQVEKRLSVLEGTKDTIDLEDLSNNEQFITALLSASQAAMRTHEEEKLEALCNAVLNTVTPNDISEDLQLVFLSLIDNLTGWHLRILKFFDNPGVWFKNNDIKLPSVHTGSPSAMLETAYSELKNR